uniref:G domain-containing protein n=1 Tax=Panagrolaimus superbus TaxID=310955 RepID=A0A914YYQ2_9BILA
MDKTFSQYEYCLRNDVIQNVRQKLHDLKEFYNELEKQLHQNLMDIRSGRKYSSILNEILHRYRSSRYTPQAMASIYQEFDRYREKIRFVHYLSMNKVACFGRETSVEVERIKNNFHHCFEYYCDWSNVNNLFETSNLFIKLIKNGTQMVFVDLEVNPRARNINVVPEGNRICQYFNGRYTDKDYLQTWKEKQSKCFVKCLGQKKSVPKNISKFVYVKLPCPQSFKDESCGAAECEWYCADCEQRLQYDFKQHFYCRCGIAPVEAYQFHCSDQHHGESYVTFENNDKLYTLIHEIRPYEEVNILLLGETGVGKTTFINSSANAVTYSKLEEAEMSEPICLIPSQFTCTELDNDERVVRKIQIGQSENENFKDGESCTQSPKSHVVIVGNKLIRYIDTPGIGDTRGTTTDKENFASILQYISQFDKIHGICVLLKPNESRLNLVFKYCINELLSHLHVSAAANIVFCFTRARETFYQPGDSWPILKRYVDELYDNRNVKLDLSTKSVYCFDNEAFRFLHLMRNGVKYTDDERAIFEKSWEISVKESQRLLNHFQNDVAPHIVNETVSLNEARQIILTAAQPLADITKNIQKNYINISRQQTEIQQADAYDFKLRGKLMIKHIGFETEEIEYPRTVCNSSTCTETKKQPNSEVKKVIYKAICHDHCYLKNVTPETAPNPALQECAAMDADLICKECGCQWDTHLHIRFIQREVEKEVEDENVRRSIDQNKSEIEIQLDAIKSLEERIDEYEKVQADIDQILAKFASFLKENAILAYNDTVEDYLKLNIRDEKEQIPPNYELLKKMEEQLDRYQEEKRILDSRLESGEIQHVQPGDIKELQKELENLPLVGKDFKILFDATVNGVKKNLQVGQQQPHDPYNQAAVQKYHPKNRNDNERQLGKFESIGQSIMSLFG